MPSQRSRSRSWITVRRVSIAFLIAVVVLIALPYPISVIYRFADPVSTPMLWRWLTGARVERIRVPLGQISRSVPAAVIAAEDGQFCAHWGVDFAGLREAITEADDLDEARGGSTITQQVVKNLFLWNSRSYLRKALELPLALWFDLVVPKARIMEIYLNVAERGANGEFGVEAGARYAFGQPARGLSLRQAALLAAVLPNPMTRSARRPGPGMQRLGQLYERRAGAVSTECLRRGN
jgi:monofunctional biosynthetic peptidoglycan transglycosylase